MSQTVQAALIWGTQLLRDAKITGANRDAQRLMAAALGQPMDRLILAMQDALNSSETEAYREKLMRRASGVPVSHILGHREFYGRSFIVTSDVLDPRPETEILVDTALEQPFTRVLDLGTGSGAIIVSLLAERVGVSGVGSDVSDPALTIASQNAVRHGVEGRLHLLNSDWFASVEGKFDLIVANPPYIARAEMADLQAEVRLHEPQIALTDGADGLSAYRMICAHAAAFCVAGARIVFEIGPTQAAAVSQLLLKGGFVDVNVKCDLDRRNRVVWARKPAI